MEISQRQEGDVLILTCHGRLDHHGAEIFGRLSEDLIAAGCRNLIVDFQGINFLASVGIRALVLPAQQLAQLGGHFSVIRLSESVRGVFALAGLDNVFLIYEDETSALEALR